MIDMQQLFFKYLSFILLCGAITAQEPPFCSSILEYAKENLPSYGTLKNSDGFVYVDIDDEYIHRLIEFILEEGFEEPPYFGHSGLAGAHITVAYPEEMEKYNISKIEECETSIFFTPMKCQVVRPLSWQGIEEVYVIVVSAPQLDDLRKKYGLPKSKYDFHITIGIKPKIAESA